MNVGLIDVDSHNYPNLALMKLSAWHKQQGDVVGWYNIFESYDIVYMSKVFSFTPDYGFIITNAQKVVKGGTGYELHDAGGQTYIAKDDEPLPYVVEHITPDYSLYGITDTAYGYLTRGCPRGCSFCIVGKKEGTRCKKVADLSEFWSGQKNIVLHDPNILACREWKDLFSQLEDSKAMIDFNQGLDARLLTREKCEAIDRIRVKEIHFAWDRYEDKEIILPKLKMFAEIRKQRPHGHVGNVFVLVNYGTTIQQDLERIYALSELNYWPYVMVYDKRRAPKIYLELQRWCNNRIIFAS